MGLEKMLESKIRDKKGRFKPGHPGTHGAYKKRLPARLRREAAAYRLELVKDLGGEENISTAKLLLIDKAMNLWQVTRAIEDFINIQGAFKGKKLEPVLAENYVTYCNALRLCLREIGLNPSRPQDKQLAPLELAAAVDRGEYDAELKSKPGG